MRYCTSLIERCWICDAVLSLSLSLTCSKYYECVCGIWHASRRTTHKVAIELGLHLRPCSFTLLNYVCWNARYIHVCHAAYSHTHIRTVTCDYSWERRFINLQTNRYGNLVNPCAISTRLEQAARSYRCLFSVGMSARLECIVRLKL